MKKGHNLKCINLEGKARVRGEKDLAILNSDMLCDAHSYSVHPEQWPTAAFPLHKETTHNLEKGRKCSPLCLNPALFFLHCVWFLCPFRMLPPTNYTVSLLYLITQHGPLPAVCKLSPFMEVEPVFSIMAPPDPTVSCSKYVPG